MKSENLISIVTPVYNAAPWLDACLQSVLSAGSAATVFWKTRVSKRSENLANHFKTTMGFRLAL